MGESFKLALRMDLKYLLVPTFLAVVAMIAFAAQSASADHNGPHATFVSTDDPTQDLSDPATPLNVFVGDEFSVDLVVEFPTPGDHFYAGEYHVNVEHGRGILGYIEGDPQTPDFSLFSVSSENLALADAERLRTTIEGFAENGHVVRGCDFDPTPPPGDDSVYTFIKGATGDDTTIQLQLLNQHQRPEWGDGWCAATAAGISLAWFAETLSGDAAALIPHVGPTITTADKYNAIATLGMMMNTSSGDGTSDNDVVDGIEAYIGSVGLTGDFVIKVFNRPSFRAYANELDTGDEDVLVRVLSGDGSSHWMVGRSFSDVLETGDTPDTGDDYWPVSFVDPGTASIYHSRMRRVDRTILYDGEWYEFDLMVSVSPTTEPTN